MKQTVNVMGAKEKADLTFSRVDVLLRLWDVSNWLDGLRVKKELKINDALKTRLYIAQIENSHLKTLIYGLKDEELEIRVKELEEKLEKGVLIPHEREK